MTIIYKTTSSSCGYLQIPQNAIRSLLFLLNATRDVAPFQEAKLARHEKARSFDRAFSCTIVELL